MDPTQESSTLKASLNILRSAPLSDVDANLTSLQEILSSNPDALNELAQHVHLPLQTAIDNDKPFITCSWNRSDNGSYQSPFSSNPNEHKLQALANELWITYSKQYFGSNAVASAYVVESLSEARLCFLMKNVKPDVGEWNSCHVVVVSSTNTTTFVMKSNVLVMLTGDDTISAHVAKTTSTCTNKTTSPLQYMETIGPMLESVETELRSSLENVHLPKLQDAAMGVRKKKRTPIITPGMNHTDMLNQAVLARAAMQQKKKE